ncbi:DUF1652 domain-containing protein [Pseudomonas matsuisoli]|uniref:Uncharacterized protein n=1 Tax=Pseudomonas matsuisoli TaxID=1515666 RepID=A0A917PX96_9PSED|nr:DUF1652 domain-containing protein [Pseudomonas matsuisoli]GGJ95919.1 hypothetical protein GCM10009304_22310 [Pseudomonas matsuisoli]
MEFPRACELLNIYFEPFRVDVRKDGAGAFQAELNDPVSGETLLAVRGLRCPHNPSMQQLRGLIRSLEEDLAAVSPQSLAMIKQCME